MDIRNINRRAIALWVVSLVLVISAAPAFATGNGAPHPVIYPELYQQDAEPTAEAPVDPAPVEPTEPAPTPTWLEQNGLTLVLVAALLAVTIIGQNNLKQVARDAGQLVPAFAIDAIDAGSDRLLQTAEMLVANTPSRVDDEIVRELRELRAELLAAARGTPPVDPA